MEFHWKRLRAGDGYDQTFERHGSKAVLVGHLVYYTGLRNQRGRTGDILDLRRRVWTPIAATDPDLSLFYHSATLVDDCILLFGAEEDDASAQLYALDLVESELRVVPTVGEKPGLAGFHSADLYEEKRQLFCLGNLTRDWRSRGDSLMILHLDGLRWEFVHAKGVVPSLQIRHGSCIANHTLFVLDGHSFHIYTLRLNQPTYIWQRIVFSAPRGSSNYRDNASLFSLGNNRIIVLGGRTGEAWRDIVVVEKCCSQKPEFKTNPKIVMDRYAPMNLQLGCVVKQHEKLVALHRSALSKSDYFELHIK